MGRMETFVLREEDSEAGLGCGLAWAKPEAPIRGLTDMALVRSFRHWATWKKLERPVSTESYETKEAHQ